jgi:hypothetical protein
VSRSFAAPDRAGVVNRVVQHAWAVLVVVALQASAAIATPGVGDIDASFIGVESLTRGGTQPLVFMSSALAWTHEDLPVGADVDAYFTSPLSGGDGGFDGALLVGGHVDVLRTPHFGVRVCAAGGPELLWPINTVLVARAAGDATVGPYVRFAGGTMNVFMSAGFGYAWFGDLFREHARFGFGVSW